MKRHMSIFLLTLFCTTNAFSQPQLPQLGKNSVHEVISAMTLQEKSKFVVGNGFHMPAAQQAPAIGQTQDKVPGAAGTTFAIPRLGIPSIVLSDGPAGVQISPVRNGDSIKTFYATSFPVGTALAATWNTDLVRQVGVAFGEEVHEYGIDIILGPALNIQRNPLGGRNFEYLSEDPLLTGDIAAAMVNGIQSNGVGTSIKHFALNNAETNRFSTDAIVSERALREIYLKGFKTVVKKAHPWTVMSSYNKINGIYTSESPDLLINILRDEWGFKGFVMTDWFGGTNPIEQMGAENNLLMPGTPKQSETIEQAVKDGRLSEEILDRNIASILKIIVESPAFKQYKFSDQPNLKGHAVVSKNAATEGMVLVKNENQVLPLGNKTKSITLFGINGYDLIPGGKGSGSVNAAYTVSLAEGLVNHKFRVDNRVAQVYKKYLTTELAKQPKKSIVEEFMNPTPPIGELVPDDALIAKQAATSSIAIISIGRNFGEGNDRKIENDFLLSDAEQTMIQKVADAFHAKNKKVVVVLNTGGVMEVASWRDKVDAILIGWQPGLEGGNAIAEILSGKVNPSGKLPMTFPMKYEDVPSATTFPGKEFPELATTETLPGQKNIPMDAVYNEGIYVGYRYYNTFNVKPAYDFGYGLSYTSFDYGHLELSSDKFNQSITAKIKITNTGKVAGREVVQLYIGAPGKTMDKPTGELKAFAKTRLLQPGEIQELSFTVNPEQLASFDSRYSSWIAEPGKYQVKVGASSTDIKQTVTFGLDQEIVVEKVHHELVPATKIAELKR